MNTSVGANDVVVKLAPGGDAGLAHLSNRELLAKTRELIGRSNQVFAALLAHLAEVDARGLHRTKACASLYTYCIYELRLSEDAAARRAGAAKLVKRFPLLLEAIARGELHLTGLLMLGPHLTSENLVEVLGRAKFRTKKELARLVRELHPLPLVPDLVEPLRPEPGPLRKPTCEEYAASLAPAIRELPVGERPRDWANDANETTSASSPFEEPGTGDTFDASMPLPVSAESFLPAPARVEPLWPELPPITGPQQYQVQFSTTEEHVQLIERAKALLARSTPGKSLGELHLKGMRLLVASLEKQKLALTEHPRPKSSKRTSANKSSVGKPPRVLFAESPLIETAGEPCKGALESRAGHTPRPTPLPTAATASRPGPEPRSGRQIPATVRRAVYERDGARCTYVDERGARCQETHFLELHHQRPFSKGGTHTATNLTVHCRAHNALVAELDFGRTHMAESQESGRYSSLASERRDARRREKGPD
jgi:hypothetical protein